MSQSKQRQKKATASHPRPDVWFKEVSADVLRNHLVQLRESMGEGEVYDTFRMMTETMLLVRDEAGRKGVSIQRLRFLLFGPKTESFAAVCREATQGKKPKEPREKAKGHGGSSLNRVGRGSSGW